MLFKHMYYCIALITNEEPLDLQRNIQSKLKIKLTKLQEPLSLVGSHVVGLCFST